VWGSGCGCGNITEVVEAERCDGGNSTEVVEAQGGTPPYIYLLPSTAVLGLLADCEELIAWLAVRGLERDGGGGHAYT